MNQFDKKDTTVCNNNLRICLEKQEMQPSSIMVNYINPPDNGMIHDKNLPFTSNSNPGDDLKLVYFAIERKWKLVGPGIFR